MCGIFGIVVGNSSTVTPRTVRSSVAALLELSESRGKEAAGLALSYGDHIQVLKRPFSASELIRSEEYRTFFETGFKNGSHIPQDSQIPESFALIGHSRLVTNGTSAIHQNNQPVIRDGIVGIHNGIVVNDLRLWSENPELKRNYDVDTEVILALIRKHLNRGLSLIDATKQTFRIIQGQASIATLFGEFNALLIATNNGSLYLGSSNEHRGFVFASEESILREFLRRRQTKRDLGEFTVHRVAPGMGCVLFLDDLSSAVFALNDATAGQVTNSRAPVGIARQVIDLGESKSSRNRKSQTLDLASIVLPEVLPEFEAHVQRTKEAVSHLRRCTKCVLPETIPFIDFDAQGVCLFCRIYKPISLLGREALESEVRKFRSGNERLDCCVALSGGRDSTYGLHYIKQELGLNPVAYTYDWGMVTDLARRNISRICGKLGIEHILVSADIRRKRDNIRKNVSAWLQKPDIGMVPLFMAGDKQFYYHANRLKKETGVGKIVFCENLLETTNFKTGFCGTAPRFGEKQTITLPFIDKLRMLWYYGSRFATNSEFLNSSLLDTFLAYCSYYVIPHDYLYLYQYVPWIEEEITETLINDYDWEVAGDTKQTWRIGDGTAAFYNYIYFNVAGFTENDTFRSNQIREGMLSRDQALKLIATENLPRWDTIREYLSVINVDFHNAINRINTIARMF